MSRINENYLNSRLKLRQLLVFHCIYESRSLVQASKKLNVTQPALTRTIRDLEDIFNNPLFHRTNRGLLPTLFGDALAKRAAIILAEIRYATDELNALANAHAGHVIVGSIVSASAYLLPAAIAEIKKTAPGIVITVREAANDILIPALANGEIDMLIWRIPEETYTGLDHRTVYQDTLSVVVRPDHPLTKSQDVILEHTLAYPWIVPIPESPVRQIIDHCFQACKLEPPRNIVESISVLTNIRVLAQTDTIAILPDAAAERLEKEGSITRLPIEGLGDFGKVGISTWQSRELPPAAKRFYDCVLQVSAELA